MLRGCKHRILAAIISADQMVGLRVLGNMDRSLQGGSKDVCADDADAKRDRAVFSNSPLLDRADRFRSFRRMEFDDGALCKMETYGEPM